MDKRLWTCAFIIMGRTLDVEFVKNTFALNIKEVSTINVVNPVTKSYSVMSSVVFDIDEAQKQQKLENQLLYWISALEPHRDELVHLKELDSDIFIMAWMEPDGFEAFAIPHALSEKLGQLKIDLEFHFQPIELKSE